MTLLFFQGCCWLGSLACRYLKQLRPSSAALYVEEWISYVYNVLLTRTICITNSYLLRLTVLYRLLYFGNPSYCSYMYLNPTADCGAPSPPINGSLQPHTNTTEGLVVVFQCRLEFVPEGEITAVCGSDGQWTPNPGDITCSPRPTPTQTSTFTQATTPTETSLTSKNYTLHFIMYML